MRKYTNNLREKNTSGKKEKQRGEARHHIAVRSGSGEAVVVVANGATAGNYGEKWL